MDCEHMDCEHIEEWLEAYALGALAPGEMQLVEAHLAECVRCRAAARAYAELTSALPETLAAVSPVQLPASLKLLLLQTLEGSSAQSSAEVQTGPRKDGYRHTTGLDLLPARLLGARRLHLALVAASVLLILSIAWSIRLNVVLAHERALRAEFAELVDQQEVVLEVIDSNQTERRVLRSIDPDARAYGKLFTRTDMPHVVAMAARLDPPPPGHGYHFGVTAEGETKLAGVFNVNDEGFGLLLFDDDRDGPTYEAAEVILQPVGTVTPMGPVMLRWNEDP